MEYPDWNWAFHGEIVANDGDREIAMKLVRCLSRNPECQFKQQQICLRWVDLAKLLDAYHKIIKIPRAEKCDYLMTTCVPYAYFRSIWECRRPRKQRVRALKFQRASINGMTSTHQPPLPLAHARNSYIVGQQQTDNGTENHQQ